VLTIPPAVIRQILPNTGTTRLRRSIVIAGAFAWRIIPCCPAH
jgi:hypothetical protein